MKKILTIAAACTLATLPAHAAETAGQKAAAYYQQGQAAEKAGDPAAAKEAYTQALKADPGNANARYSLGQLKITSATIAAKGREEKLGAVVIPLYQLDDATLKEALDALGIMIEKQTKDELAPNFIIEDPKKAFAEQKISLNLKNTPTKGILKYLTDQVGAKVRYDEHAVVVIPKG